MTYILKIKHWQIFSFVIIAYIISRYFASSLISGDMIRTIWALFAILWNLLLGLTLYSISPVELRFNKLPYVVASVLLIVAGIVISLMTKNREFEFLPVIIIGAIISLAALFYIASFPARVLKSLELNRKATPMEYGEYLFPFLIFMIGVWIYQPRLNRIEKELVVEKNLG